MNSEIKEEIVDCLRRLVDCNGYRESDGQFWVDPIVVEICDILEVDYEIVYSDDPIEVSQ